MSNSRFIPMTSEINATSKQISLFRFSDIDLEQLFSLKNND
ncbi:7490_t:CDS:2 [Funneliformis caledonium]|uniref:7490_t:CDS:1 n=1 Tax=Funneliformis caledonium TaxID=1117310 RepID=A0A9N8VS33_9GLOM|nr:7490_t:CDS:2 [Funneliformis caledonium]